MVGRWRKLGKMGALLLAILALPYWQGGLQAGEFPVADKVVVDKSSRKLHLLKSGVAFRTFQIALGIRPIGDKEHEGDFKTPEGRYLLPKAR